jgi:micrococcal nuclease
MYQYHATIGRWVDGDTVYLTIDLGFRVLHIASIRLEGFDAPEVRGDERERGLAVVKRCKERWPRGTEVTLESHGRDKYGRYVGTITDVKTGREINTIIAMELIE